MVTFNEELPACLDYFSGTALALLDRHYAKSGNVLLFFCFSWLAGQYREVRQKYYQEKIFIHLKTFRVELNPGELTTFVLRNNRDFPPILIFTKTHL